MSALAGLRVVTVGAVASGVGAVVKLQDALASGLLAMSRIAVVPPVRRAVYWVFAARFAAGFRTTVFVAAS